MTVLHVAHPSLDERAAHGVEAREVAKMIPGTLTFYARTCGWTLARAHARSGVPVAIARYLGDRYAFDQSITDFSARYAEQNEQNLQALVAVGRLQAVEGV
jgi:hypothetical protein